MVQVHELSREQLLKKKKDTEDINEWVNQLSASLAEGSQVSVQAVPKEELLKEYRHKYPFKYWGHDQSKLHCWKLHKALYHHGFTRGEGENDDEE